MNTPNTIPFERQLTLLIEILVDKAGRPYSLPKIAAATGITHQALHNLVHGKVKNPRLETLQALSEFYEISLDYFELHTEEACRAYLLQRWIDRASPILREIAKEADHLSTKGQKNLLTILQWVEIGRSQ